MTVQGSKNAVLPILASTILIAGKTTLRNCPDISDVDCMCRILQKIGATVTKKVTRSAWTLPVRCKAGFRQRKWFGCVPPSC